MGLSIKDINGKEFVFTSMFNNSITSEIWNNNGDQMGIPLTDIVGAYGTDFIDFANTLFADDATDDEYLFTLKNGNYIKINRYVHNKPEGGHYYEYTTPLYYKGGTEVKPIGISTSATLSFIWSSSSLFSGKNHYYQCIYPYNNLTAYDDINMMLALQIRDTRPDEGELTGWYGSLYNTNEFITACLNGYKKWLEGLDIPSRYDDNYSEIDDGNGDFNNTSDIISQELNDTLIQFGGFANIYQITQSSLNSLYDWLWTDDIITNLSKMFSSPLDSILSLQIAPISDTQLPLGTSQNIILANIDTKVQAKPLIKGFIRIDCGTLTLSEYFGNFLDYPPYTQIECYIPYVGYVTLDATDVMSSEIQLYYDIDLANGFFTANIVVVRDRYDTQLNAILYTYSGSMFYNVPITSADYSAVTSGLINVATNALSGNVGGFAGSSAALLVATSHPNIQRSGSISNNANLVTLRVPHVRITRPRLAIAKTLQQEKGYYCNVTCKLSDLSGYVEVRHVDLSNISRATENEKSEIENLLNSGVFI